jgi:hypothetical protein
MSLNNTDSFPQKQERHNPPCRQVAGDQTNTVGTSHCCWLRSQTPTTNITPTTCSHCTPLQSLTLARGNKAAHKATRARTPYRSRSHSHTQSARTDTVTLTAPPATTHSTQLTGYRHNSCTHAVTLPLSLTHSSHRGRDTLPDNSRSHSTLSLSGATHVGTS